MRTETEVRGVVIHKWFVADDDREHRNLMEQIYKSLVTQNKMPLTKDEFLESCTESSNGVYVYTVPEDSSNVFVRLAEQGSKNVAVEPTEN